MPYLKSQIKWTEENLLYITAFSLEARDLFDQIRPSEPGIFEPGPISQIQEEIRIKAENECIPHLELTSKAPLMMPLFYQFLIMASVDLSKYRNYRELHESIKMNHDKDHIYENIAGGDEAFVACACGKPECQFMSMIELPLNYLMLGSVCITKNGLITEQELNRMRTAVQRVICATCGETKKKMEAKYDRSTKEWNCKGCLRTKRSTRPILFDRDDDADAMWMVLQASSRR